jgi:shikimate dehydrogenase
MKKFGLTGYPLGHSFSKEYFAEKFMKENITDVSYENFPLEDLSKIKEIISSNNLSGLNVTIPHKEAVVSYMDELDETAKEAGAVNTVKILPGNRLKGYNTDVWGFGRSLVPLLNENHNKALILGSGGAAKAVAFVLRKLGIPYRQVSRTATEGMAAYDDLNEEMIAEHKLIINCTPSGMSPDPGSSPAIPYEYITSEHFLYDLVYNPEVTEFMRQGKERGAMIKNGMEMLKLQAEESWRIWNDEKN